MTHNKKRLNGGSLEELPSSFHCLSVAVLWCTPGGEAAVVEAVGGWRLTSMLPKLEIKDHKWEADDNHRQVCVISLIYSTDTLVGPRALIWVCRWLKRQRRCCTAFYSPNHKYSWCFKRWLILVECQLARFLSTKKKEVLTPCATFCFDVLFIIMKWETKTVFGQPLTQFKQTLPEDGSLTWGFKSTQTPFSQKRREVCGWQIKCYRQKENGFLCKKTIKQMGVYYIQRHIWPMSKTR